MATLMALVVASADEWQRLNARLMTPWGESIDPENVWAMMEEAESHG